LFGIDKKFVEAVSSSLWVLLAVLRSVRYCSLPALPECVDRKGYWRFHQRKKSSQPTQQEKEKVVSGLADRRKETFGQEIQLINGLGEDS